MGFFQQSPSLVPISQTLDWLDHVLLHHQLLPVDIGQWLPYWGVFTFERYPARRSVVSLISLSYAFNICLVLFLWLVIANIQKWTCPLPFPLTDSIAKHGVNRLFPQTRTLEINPRRNVWNPIARHCNCLLWLKAKKNMVSIKLGSIS